jgi:hypothetical protein
MPGIADITGIKFQCIKKEIPQFSQSSSAPFPLETQTKMTSIEIGRLDGKPMEPTNNQSQTEINLQ